MRKINIDFNAENILPDGSVLGKVGEHNATELLIKPPADMLEYSDLSHISVVFSMGTKRVSSDAISAADEISFIISRDFTKVSVVSLQLEGYDGNDNLLVKSDRVDDLIFESCINGEEYLGADEPPLITEIRQNTLARHSHENKDILDLLSADGKNLTYNGKSIGGFAEIDLDLLPAQIVSKLLLTGGVTEVIEIPESAVNDEIYTNWFYSFEMNSYLLFTAKEDGNLTYLSTDTYEFTESINMAKGNICIFYINTDGNMIVKRMGGESLRNLLIDGLENTMAEA